MGPPGDPVPLTESSAYSRSPQFWLKALWNLVSPLSTTECKLVTCLHTGRLLRQLFWDNSAIFFTWMTPTQQAVKCSYRVGQKRKTCWFLNKTLWLCEATSQSYGRKEGGNKTYRSLMWILLSPPTPKYKSSSREISSGGSRLWPINRTSKHTYYKCGIQNCASLFILPVYCNTGISGQLSPTPSNRHLLMKYWSK